MQAMQPYFDVDFYHYAVDRASLTTSRTRAQLISVFERKLRQSTIDALGRDLALGMDETEKRPEQANVDNKGCAFVYAAAGTTRTTMPLGPNTRRTKSTGACWVMWFIG